MLELVIDVIQNGLGFDEEIICNETGEEGRVVKNFICITNRNCGQNNTGCMGNG